MRPRFARRLPMFRDKIWVDHCIRSKVSPDDWLAVLYAEGTDIVVDKLGCWDHRKFELRYDLGYKNKKRAV